MRVRVITGAGAAGARRRRGTVVDATAQAGSAGRLLPWASARAQLGWGSLVADFCALLCGYALAEATRSHALSALQGTPIQLSQGWSVVVLVIVTAPIFYVLGLYDLEAYVSRPLHLWTLLTASLIAFAVSALSVYMIAAHALEQSRVAFLMTFVFFVLFTCALRFGILDEVYRAWLRQHKPISVLVGDFETTQTCGERLGRLRGFDQLERVSPASLSHGAEEAVRTVLEHDLPSSTRVAAVFVDASSLTPREAFETAEAARTLGTEVYVISELLGALESNRLRTRLFGTPVIRIRRSITDARPYSCKRALDIVGSAALLLLAAPVIALLAMAIRLTSRGPVFYRQTRVGRSGAPFQFLKLRSMITDGDEGIHVDYVKAFMNGTADAIAASATGEAIFKKVDDPRITPVGRFIRKYSLDEIPQFWNVFCGDMSLVGPRPSLPYEVREYDEWNALRMTVPAGITGLWQVRGRSRVSFDEMILQDLMYAQNMRLLVDVGLCLRTLPAALLGGGGG